MDLGLRFIVEPVGPALTSQEKDLLGELRPAGVMFRKRNFLQHASYSEWLACYSELLDEVWSAIGRPNIFVTIDHEGGRVHRFPEPITRFPYAAHYATSPVAIERVAQAMAVELISLGINLSFSPVADIHSNSNNPVINQRAFGRTPDEVCLRTSLFARALSQHGVVPCAKHFPGHGDTGTDSHFSLPIIAKSLDELLATELRPFVQLIADDIPMVMSAHIMVPQVDPKMPATLSRPMMRDVLREQLGFKGVSIADALGMQAIKEFVDADGFGMSATRAGIDLMLYAGDPVSIEDAVRCKAQLERALTEDVDLARLAQQSEERIGQLLLRMPRYSVTALDPNVLSKHAALRDSVAGNQEWGEFDLSLPGYD